MSGRCSFPGEQSLGRVPAQSQKSSSWGAVELGEELSPTQSPVWSEIPCFSQHIREAYVSKVLLEMGGTVLLGARDSQWTKEVGEKESQSEIRGSEKCPHN